MAPRTFADLAIEVAESRDLAVFDMGLLRDLQGAGKLGKYVRQDISESLRGHGLGHFPEELPIYQHEDIRVYRRDSAVGRVVDAILHPSTRGDASLRALVESEDHQIVEQIRRLVES